MGIIHPDAMLSRMTANQFGEWMEYYGIEPFGEQRADLRSAIVAATMNNRWRNKNEEPLQPLDFMPFHRPPQQSPDEIRNALRRHIR